MNRIEDIINEDNNLFQSELDRLKLEATIARDIILTTPFKRLDNESTEDDIIIFIVEMIPLVSSITLFSDELVEVKLRSYGFSSVVIKWFTSCDLIVGEINRIANVNGLIILKPAFLTAARFYLETKIFHAIIESFDLHIKHGKDYESNILHKAFDNLFRKREYNSSKGQIGKMKNDGNLFIDKLITLYENKMKGKLDFKKMLLNGTRGGFTESKKVFSSNYVASISKPKVYFEFYPLFKMIYKDRNMYSEYDFDELSEVIYNGNYRKYKISRVKKIIESK